MSLEFRIRAARADDIESVIALERSIASAPHWPEAEYAAIPGADAGGAVRRCLLVAERGAKERQGDLIGFAVGKVIGAGAGAVAELESVAVAEQARRTGVGRALCAATIEWSLAEGAANVELEVRSTNISAIGLYDRLGFVRTGLRRGYYRDPEEDAVLMQRQI